MAFGICQVSETRSDNDKLAFCRSLQNQNAVDLHVGPTKSLDAFRSRRGRHGPIDEVVRERKGLLVLEASRTGMSRDGQEGHEAHQHKQLVELSGHSFVSLFRARIVPAQSEHIVIRGTVSLKFGEPILTRSRFGKGAST